MSLKAKGGGTAEVVRALAQPAADELGLDIWDIRFLKEGSDWFLRVFIDKEGGVDMNDCVNLSRALDKLLDDADPIQQSYCLEVSSPGVEREFAKDEHFEKTMGKKIQLKLIRPHENVREFKGTLEAYNSGDITIKTENGSNFTFNKKNTSWVRLDDFGGFSE